jgi:hypothetical protein
MFHTIARALAGLLLWQQLVSGGSEAVETSAGDDEPLPAVAYLLYEVDPGEGFNFRKGCLHRVLSLATRLQKLQPEVEWVVVPPPFRSRHSQDYYPVGAFFDLQKFQRDAFPAGRIIEASAYFAAAGQDGSIDRDVHFLPGFNEAALGPPLPPAEQEPGGSHHHALTGKPAPCPVESVRAAAAAAATRAGPLMQRVLCAVNARAARASGTL